MQLNKTDLQIAWFGALCFFLSTIEYMIPKPLPFLRLGLANLPIMLSINILPLPSFFILVAIKILGQGLIGGTLFSYIFLFSAVGTLTSAGLMLLVKKAFPKSVSYIGLSVIGAFSSNASQLLIARYTIFGESAWYIAPPFLAAGLVSGILLGLFANRFSAKSCWYADVMSGKIDYLSQSATNKANELDASGIIPNTAFPYRIYTAPLFRFSAGFIILLLLLFTQSLIFLTIIVCVSFALVLSDASRIKMIPIVIMSLSIIIFNLASPFGKILIQTPFNLPITEGALLLGIKKALTIEGMLFISKWMLKPGFKLPGKPGLIVSEVFTVLAYLTGSRKKFDPKNIISSIDDIMYGRDLNRP